MNTKKTSRKTMKASVILACIILVFFLVSCQGNNNSITDSNSATVKKGNITSNVEIRGKLEMPRAIKLRFGTPGLVQKIYVTYGNKVKAGTLLAKLDDTSQKLAVQQAQYSVEIALNELVEKTYSTVLGYPDYYPPISALLRLESAQKEVAKAQDQMQLNNYRQAMTEVRLALHDLKASREMLNPPAPITIEDYPNIFQAIDLLVTDINLLEQDQETKLSVQSLIGKGFYDKASVKLATVMEKLKETYLVVNSVCGVIKSYFPLYPDTSTSMDILKQVKDSLEKLQMLVNQDSNDTVEVAENLRLALHDLEMSNAILEKSELIFHHGLNLKLLRLNNLNLQKAEKALDNAKVELMKTEILAPFDGIVVDIPVKENEQLSAVDYASRTIVELVDISKIELYGTIDEIDVRKIANDQSVDIFVDVVPHQKFTGKVTFISPYGSLQTGTTSFMIQMQFDPTNVSLQRGLSATAVIPVGKRDNVLLVPTSAIRSAAGEYWVGVVQDRQTGKIEKRYVTLGLDNSNFTEVVSGLKEGDLVTLQTLHK